MEPIFLCTSVTPAHYLIVTVPLLLRDRGVKLDGKRKRGEGGKGGEKEQTEVEKQRLIEVEEGKGGTVHREGERERGS